MTFTVDLSYPWVNNQSAFVSDIDLTCDSIDQFSFLKKLQRWNMYSKHEKLTCDTSDNSYMKTFSDNYYMWLFTTGWWIIWQDRFPRKSNLTEDNYRQDKKLSGKTDKEADETNDNTTDFPDNPNWLKKIIGKTKHCLDELIKMLMKQILIRQIFPQIQIEWRR